MSLATNVRDLATRAATEDKALRTLLNGNAADLSALSTTAKTNLVAAINEVTAQLAAASAINDNATAAGTTWSSTKIDQEVKAAVAALIGGAASDRDTLKELGDLLTSEDSAIAAINTALGVRVRVDAAQSLNATQQAQGRDNIGAASAAAVGDTTTDFVAAFVAGLA